MSSTILTSVKVVREALRLLHNNLVFTRGINKQYSGEFAQSGAKVGQSINIRKPNKYYVTKAVPLVAQDTSEEYTTLTVDQPYQIGLNFTDVELTLSLDDFSKRVLKPAMARLASQIDYDNLGMAKDVYNQVGTPGTTPGSSTGGTGMLCYTTPNIFLNAGAMLDYFATPRDGNRHIVLDPIAQASAIGGLSGLFNNQQTLGEQYKSGIMGNALGFEFAMDQNINKLTTGGHDGTAASIQVSGGSQTGATLVTKGWTASQTDVMKAGEIFTLSGVYSVNPENQESTGLLQQFVVTADADSDGSGNATLSISPSIVVAGTGVANGTVTASPANATVITMGSGSSDTAYPLSLAYHEDAFTFATVDLLRPNGVHFAAREVYDGISMLIVQQYDINSRRLPCRIDILAGRKTLRPEMACRIAG